ncbi:hypothetical protein SISNIDRAFT_459735 [Sistotremastrum niveocremeum HHB9708]|uniref:Tat pathway signal sequence n=2 Tax=Sistotremastraceae TaxID=3402574 RepID=A0A164P9Q6_9AGAM|nr:hypothetical protein SISNIDRAFT_459735 [Sistotremastrum niveocremeum HHB9708]KZT32729.1 hypothetical protein SISSUDRAFT_1055164 [Sistotremastrum suecicum HHB10207 ss-3]
MSSVYHRLLSDEKPSNSRDDLESDVGEVIAARSSSKKRALMRVAGFAAFGLSLLTNAYFLGVNSRSSAVTCSSRGQDPVWGVTEPLYSPAQSVVKYEHRVFDKLGVRTPYHTPYDDATDELWRNLYDMGIQKITKDQAALLPNWTEPIPGDEGHYVVSLNVFHQLHCLNYLRMALYPERYGPAEQFGPPLLEGDPTPFDHTDHCVNIIREGITCNADITPDVWQWDERRKMAFPHFDSVHDCRNWDAIVDWAKERKIEDRWDTSIHVGHDHHHHL